MNYLLAIISAVFVSNMILSNMVSIDLANQQSTNVKKTFHLGLLVTAVLFIVMLIVHPIHQYVLKKSLADLSLIIVILILVGVVVGFTELTKHINEKIHHLFKENMPVLIFNAAILLVVLSQSLESNYLKALSISLGTGIGFMLVFLIFTSIKERFENYEAPAWVKGLPLALITIGLLAMAFLGFAGLVSI